MKAKEKELVVCRNGITHCSVCTNYPRREVVGAVNAYNPTGCSTRWKIARDKFFATGEPNPCPCNEHTKTHKHYLMVC